MANSGESATHTGKSRRQRVRLVAKLAKASYFYRDDEALLRRAWRYARLVARKDLALPNPASEADQALAGFVASTADSRSYGESRVVAEALDALAVNADPFEIRDRARGIRALASGLTDPADQVHRDLLSLAARHFDGGQAALSSLAAPSSTWLGSLESEALLRASLVEGERHFREYFSSQGGIEEEASTAILVDSLRQSVSGVQGRLSALGGRGRRVPDLRLTYRQIPKKEESSYGCDIAFVVTIRRASTLLLEAAELVQVKKPSRGSAASRPFLDRWRIDSPQLRTLLARAPSAVYWLIGPTGDVLVVPAKVLAVLARPWRPAGAADPKSFSVDYFGVRSAAVPLSQFLVDLLAGLWLGSIDRSLLEFARGQARRTSPRLIVEVAVELEGGDRKG